MKPLDNCRICIVGLGYVGLPLANEFARKTDFPVIGYDINKRRIEQLRLGKDVTLEIPELELSSKIIFTYENQDIASSNVYIITVPTPINENKEPDLKPLEDASAIVAKHLDKGDIVIYESTVYPGCTEEFCVPILESISGLKLNIDFFIGYSPERINPGDKTNTLSKIIKVTSGSNEFSADYIDELYKRIITAGTHKASSIKVAEASKAIENAQRDLNISFMNEIALLFDKIGIDTNEVLEAAGTKWNFLKFTPGLVGGHCISVDPYYLIYKAKELDFFTEVIASGRRVNEEMSRHLAHKLIKFLKKSKPNKSKYEILIMGVTFKENCPDTRNSKVIDLIKELLEFGYTPHVYDPLADLEKIHVGLHELNVFKDRKKLSNQYDGIILAVPHQIFLNKSHDFLYKDNPILIDVKGVLPKEKSTYRL